MELSFKEIEINKLNLGPDDVLVVKLVGQDFMDQDTVTSIQNYLKQLFPTNKISIVSLNEGHDVKFETVSSYTMKVKTEEEKTNCATTPSSYCGDCNCGKREAAEALTKEQELEAAKLAIEQDIRDTQDIIDQENPKSKNDILTEDYGLEPESVFKKMEFLKKQFGVNSIEEEKAIEEAMIKNPNNFGRPDNMWDSEGNQVIKDGHLTEFGVELYKKAYEEKQKTDGENQ